MYLYHRSGLDQMSESPKNSKNELVNAIAKFNILHSRRPNSFLTRTFFDAKSDEIEQIFSEGPSVEISKLMGILQKVAPMQASKWRNIKF